MRLSVVFSVEFLKQMMFQQTNEHVLPGLKLAMTNVGNLFDYENTFYTNA